jgi:acetolactate synthase I/II/III large subunit
MNGAEALVAMLRQMGVPFIAALCGNGLDPLLEAARAGGLPAVDMRNEQAASYMADAYARLTGRLGVCAVSSGVAHVHALAGIANAYFDGAPLLLISGASPSATLGRGGFQDMDQVALAEPMVKHAEMVTRSDRIPSALREAAAAALSARPGPVHLTISVDALQGEVSDDEVTRLRAPNSSLPARTAGDADGASRALTLLAFAERPLIVAGSGAFYAQAGPALQAFTRQTATPVVVPIWDRGVVDTAWDSYLGVVGAASGEPDLLARADLVILLGATVDYRLRYLASPPFPPDLQVIRVDSDPRQLYQGITPHVAIAGDVQTVLEHWSDMWSSNDLQPHTAWLEEARTCHYRFYSQWDAREASSAGEPMGGDLLVRTMASALDANHEEPVFLIDGGNIGQWAHVLLASRRYPSNWLTCGASAVVGWGVPGAMAARMAYLDRPVLLLTGDGALGFGLVEFESAARQGIPFVAVVADDSAWGIVASGQEPRYGRRLCSDLGPADYAGAAAALGARGVHANTPEELHAVIDEAWHQRRPTLIQVPVAPGGPADRVG